MSQLEAETPQADVFAAYREGGLLPGGFPLSAHSNVLEASRVVKAGPGRFFGLSVFNSKAAAQFILVFDASSVPTNGAVPAVAPLSLAATSTGALYYGSIGRWMLYGIVVCNSSTAASLTIGSADCFYDVQFI